MNKNKLLLVLVVLFAASLACDLGSSNDFRPTPTPSETPPTTQTPLPTETPSATFPNPEDLITPTPPATSIPDTVIDELQPSGIIDTGGIVIANTTLITDTGNHVGGGFLKLPNVVSLTITSSLQTGPDMVQALDILSQGGVEHETEGTYWSLSGSDTFVDVYGVVNDEGHLKAAGKGEVAGFSNVSVYLDAKITENTLSGQYWMGWLGELPGGESSVFQIEGMKIEALELIDARTFEEISEFTAQFSSAVQNQDTTFLLDRLADVSFEKYGQPACQTTIEALNDPTFNVAVNDFRGPEDWTWERDGFTVVVPNALTLQADVTSQGETNPAELHLVIGADDLLSWVTDCGDPLP